MSTWGRVIGAVSITAGVVGAAALGGVTAQRRAVRKFRQTGADGDQRTQYGSLTADRTYSVVTEDGVVLHVEECGPVDAPLTVVFAHGWTLRNGAWHFQRLGLAGPGFGRPEPGRKRESQARLVFYDQRSHGQSGRAGDARSTMTDLAQDLALVIATSAHSGPVVLIGHSMGGMALITLAGMDPALFASRVVGVGLVSTSASEVSTSTLGKTLLSSNSPLMKVVSAVAGRYAKLVERGRSSSRDAVWLLTRRLGFARTDVPGELVDYLDEMISATPLEIILEFAPALLSLNQADALAALADLPVVVICGLQDRVTPPDRSRFIVQSLPHAKLVLIEDSGHMAIMESAEEVNDALRDMLRRADAFAAADRRRVGSR